MEGRFVSLQNLSIVAAQASINTVLAAGMTFVILTGGIDLSVGSILAASAMLGLIVSLLPNYSFLGFETCLFYRTSVGPNQRCSNRFPASASFHRDAGITHRRTWPRPSI